VTCRSLAGREHEVQVECGGSSLDLRRALLASGFESNPNFRMMLACENPSLLHLGFPLEQYAKDGRSKLANACVNTLSHRHRQTPANPDPDTCAHSTQTSTHTCTGARTHAHTDAHRQTHARTRSPSHTTLSPKVEIVTIRDHPAPDSYTRPVSLCAPGLLQHVTQEDIDAHAEAKSRTSLGEATGGVPAMNEPIGITPEPQPKDAHLQLLHIMTALVDASATIQSALHPSSGSETSKGAPEEKEEKEAEEEEEDKEGKHALHRAPALACLGP
jgi:hypothetical protein